MSGQLVVKQISAAPRSEKRKKNGRQLASYKLFVASLASELYLCAIDLKILGTIKLHLSSNELNLSPK